MNNKIIDESKFTRTFLGSVDEEYNYYYVYNNDVHFVEREYLDNDSFPFIDNIVRIICEPDNMMTLDKVKQMFFARQKKIRESEISK
jgi:hypothetical protein